jgi:hypothetical protein
VGDNGSVTEEMVSRDSPRRRSAPLEELELLVRVSGRPEAIRAYTAAERAEADAYAASVGGSVEALR